MTLFHFLAIQLTELNPTETLYWARNWRSLHLADDLLGEVLPIQDEVIQVGGVAIVVGDFDSPEAVNPDGVSDIRSHHSTKTDTTCGRGV